MERRLNIDTQSGDRNFNMKPPPNREKGGAYCQSRKHMARIRQGYGRGSGLHSQRLWNAPLARFREDIEAVGPLSSR